MGEFGTVCTEKRQNHGRPRVVYRLQKVEQDNPERPFSTTILRPDVGPTSGLRVLLGFTWIVVAPKDQHKTTFTFSYAMFPFKHMLFGLCNALATFQRCMMVIFTDVCLSNLAKVLKDVKRQILSLIGRSVTSWLRKKDRI
ncbi:RNA-directed DNA polymerase-like protein [Gossypium australe]|uniref:RNA-directed DNA polymerase-like protein n=1 Tax=Gossypium australe TaxID=47621 RepID=A0A5B6WS55_9ROSI|nr:RNA-directed DNA polymerase-like protein [Gossypium australe]